MFMVKNDKAAAIVNQMTINQKISQMIHTAKGIPKLGIEAYNWWNEALHGVGRAGDATVFPQAIALASMFNHAFLHEIASIISDEVRAKYNLARTQKKVLTNLNPFYVHQLQYKGLTCWSPNINIFRDPRWGRGHETYGEDPFLTSTLGVAFIKGLQGNHPKYLKTIATPKHYAVHSGPEEGRHSFNVAPTKKDLYETYLPAFKGAIRDGNAQSVMSAYNAIDGIPVSMNKYFLQTILRDEFGFEGYVVSDCGAVRDIYKHHKKVETPALAAAKAVEAGCDLNCGSVYKYLKKAYKKGLISEESINQSVIRLMNARLKLGIIGDPIDNPYDEISPDIICCEKHQATALDASRKSLVLLKNNGILPLENNVKLLVVGPNADSLEVLLGNYNGTPKSYTTVLEGIKQLSTQTVLYEKGSNYTKAKEFQINKAVEAAKKVDVIINCIGLTPRIEGEEGDRFNSHLPAGDKLDLQLPKGQKQLCKALKETNKKMMSIIISGSPLDLQDIDASSDAVIQAFYPGQDGGKAIAELIYGHFSPSGRLPITFVRDESSLPHFHNYNMTNRTYKFLSEPPMYPFGYGLSYTKFAYSNVSIMKQDTSVSINVDITNVGEMDGAETFQTYISAENNVDFPNFKLVYFDCIFLVKSHSKTVMFTLDYEEFSSYKSTGEKELKQGQYYIHIGGSQPDQRSVELCEKAPLKYEITI